MSRRTVVSIFWNILEKPESTTARRPRLLAVANQKGGVGKTTTVVNLAAALAQRGARVLVVDCDPQANATTGLGLRGLDRRPSTYEVLIGDVSAPEAAVATPVPGLACVPGSRDLAAVDLELATEERREGRLRAALGRALDYDLVLLDCPPSLGLLTVNALVAADDVIVPVQCEYYALEGLGQLLDAAQRVRAAFHPGLRVSGLLLTMYDARTKLSQQVAEEVRSHFGEVVFGCVIPRSIRLSEAPSFGEPVVTLDPSARGAIAYKVLAAEVERRYGLGQPAAEAGAAPARAAGGPSGRGYGTVAPEPPGLETAFPRPLAWEAR